MSLENIINSCSDMEYLCCADTDLFSSEDSAHQSGSKLSSLHVQALSSSRFLSGTGLNHLPLTHLVISFKVSYIIASVLSAHSAGIFENVLTCSTLTHLAFFIHWDIAVSTDALLEGIRFTDLVEKYGCVVLVHDMGRKRANAGNQMALARLTKGTNVKTFLLTENPSSDHLFPPINPNQQGLYFDSQEQGGFWEQVDSKTTSPVPCDTDATY
ncbi:hypothetical protein CYLTODRAFT_486888 [Cylindrobasidium torrendii FP15055 ss-10]|uniref:Uncharacterized protein n=1 Tax=Cylindrobasidium torrendii FP15055 ss-10 TaxID=1314674 RepID=A0A0D7BQA2_9AGAR|nr:hypothetical protein CYLTODRAFT_486888 [Cylindrobasidium torrendii FP15055 ss-10]